jgi:hypothetical protein
MTQTGVIEMIIQCPSCGAQNSLETLIEHDEAAQALSLALSFTPCGKEIVKYVSLFRPAKSKLSWSRVNKILGEILPLIQAGKIERNGIEVDAPIHVWKSAFEKTLLARDLGSLKTPIKTHGYLFEVICTESQKNAPIQASRVEPNAIVKPLSATAQALAVLERMKTEG